MICGVLLINFHRIATFNPLTHTVVIWVYSYKHPVPDRVTKLSFVIWTSGHSDALP